MKNGVQHGLHVTCKAASGFILNTPEFIVSGNELSQAYFVLDMRVTLSVLKVSQYIVAHNKI